MASPHERTRVVSAHLMLSDKALPRLLALSGSATEFILSSHDGNTSLKVQVHVISVPAAEASLGASGVMVNWSTGTLRHADLAVSLSRMELRLLAALCASSPESVRRADLQRELWPDGQGGSGDADIRLDVLVCSLRKRLRRLGAGDVIRTLRSTGYALDARTLVAVGTER